LTETFSPSPTMFAGNLVFSVGSWDYKCSDCKSC